MPGNRDEAWPELPYSEWHETCATLHLWTQVVGKIRLACTPWLNHSWHVTLYSTARGLTTSPIPYGERIFEIAFDFIAHTLAITTSDGARREIRLAPKTVADFYTEVMSALADLGLAIEIDDRPCEIPDAIPFARDTVHRAYDAEYVQRFLRVLLQADRLLKTFRTRFIGKSSPVHFFWGSFDLAVTRFSGRRAPLHPGGIPGLADGVVREAYSHEVSSAGFWPGGAGLDRAAFYSYAYPEPPGFRAAHVDGAEFSERLGEFLLAYDAVRAAEDRDAAVLSFLQRTYEAAAETGRWDRAALECAPGQPGIPRAVS